MLNVSNLYTHVKLREGGRVAASTQVLLVK